MGSNQSHDIKEPFTKHIPHKVVVCEYKWTIEQFQDLTPKVGICEKSKSVRTDIDGVTDDWEIVLYPGGFNKRTAGFVSVYLRKISTNERHVEFTCQLYVGSQLIKKKTINKRLSLESVLGWSAFCNCSNFLESNKLENGNVTVELKCVIQVYDDKWISHPIIEEEDPYMDETVSELSKNLNQLLYNEQESDVTFEVEGKVFTAHKSILCARSAVFRAMFNSGLEHHKRTIKVTDITKEAFTETLLFLYTGKCSGVDFKTALDLYYAADKYELLSLRKICSKILAKELSAENAVTVVILAHKHSDTVLRDIAVRYIAKNAAVVQKRNDWLNLMKVYPKLANAVIKCLTCI